MQGRWATALHLALRINQFSVSSVPWVPKELFPTILGSGDALQFRFDKGTYPVACVVLGHSTVDHDPRTYDFDFIWIDPYLILRWIC
jgi:hypothetical protein